jgi:hypothetical protein
VIEGLLNLDDFEVPVILRPGPGKAAAADSDIHKKR